MARVSMCQPSTLKELKHIVEGFVADIKLEDAGKMAGNVKKCFAGMNKVNILNI